MTPVKSQNFPRRAFLRKARHRSAGGRTAIAALTAIVLGLGGVALANLAGPAQATSYSQGRAIVSDSFNRTVASGWGSAQLGGAYSVSKSTLFSVAPGQGRGQTGAPAASATAQLPATSAADVLASDVVSIPAVPTTGNGAYSGILLRNSTSGAYEAQLRLGAKGTANLSLLRLGKGVQSVLAPEVIAVPGYRAGEQIALQFQVTGSGPVSLAARAWPANGTAPGWQVNATDNSASRIAQAGDVGVQLYTSSSSVPQPVSFTQLSAWDLEPSSAPAATPTPTSTPRPTPTPTPTSTPTSAPAPPTAPQPTAQNPDPDLPVNTAGTRESAGSAVVGSTDYPIPAGSLYVSPTGSDSGSGSLASPFATVQHAVNVATTGQTIVLRGGSYNQSVTIPATKTLTIQSYPGEAAWFDGSVPVTDWQPDGTIWKAPNWDHVFDSSPTFTRGAPDGTTTGWQWINPAYPMAAHPDQLWVDGTSQQQVASLSQVKPGTFYYDTTAHVLYMGSNPSGHAVRASNLQKAITVESPGTVLRGFGVHRYAPSVPDMGAVTAGGGHTTVENLVINDNATTGLSLGGPGNVLEDTTAARNGLLGVHVDESDNLTINHVLAAGNNAEHFNTSPVSGGVKVTRSRGVTVTDSVFLDNLGPGLWMDESVYGMNFTSDDSIGNVGDGIVMEISSTATLANDLVTGNGGDGIKVDDVSDVQIWNNTLAGNARNLDITEDTRRASDPSDYGHDPRQPFPDPTMTWIDGPIAVHDNVISGGTGDCLLCVEDYSHEFSALQMGVTSNGNVYQRPNAQTPVWAVVWSTGAGNPAVYDSFAQFTAATGQDSHSLELDGAPALIGTDTLSPQVSAAQPQVALPLPGSIGSLVGEPAGTVHLGVW